MRRYLLHVPPKYDGKMPMPLILDIPALTQGAASQRSGSGNAALADAEGIVVVYLDGIGGAFNICPTENPKTNCAAAPARVRSMTSASPGTRRKVKLEGCIDPKRVYATGYSMGGGMAYFLACYAADVFAAVAPSSFDMVVMDQIPCKPARPITVVSSRGTRTRRGIWGQRLVLRVDVPGRGRQLEHVERHRRLQRRTRRHRHGLRSLQDCAAPGVGATLCTVQGGSHSPGNAACSGATSRTLDCLNRTWRGCSARVQSTSA